MRFLVLGAGALGGYFGARLLKGGADVTFLVREGRETQLKRDGLVVRTQDGEIRTPVKTVRQGQVDRPYDIVLLCCKAYDLDAAINAIAPAVGERSAVLPMLNGIRHIEVLTHRFGARQVLGGLSMINATLLPDGTIQQSPLKLNITAFGELDGQITERCIAIQQALDASDHSVRLSGSIGGISPGVSGNIVSNMWAKFFAFVCSATITSLTRSRAGAIARSATGASFVSAVIEECTRTATAEGYPPLPDTAGVIRGMFSQPESTYGPSLLVDMEKGRATEGQHTIGDMVERAARRGIDAPILGAALCNLQAYEINRDQAQGP